MQLISLDNDKIAAKLQRGAIGVFPTDTIYGLQTSVFHPESVERIYKIRKRDNKKPFIILISSLTDLKVFRVKLSKKTEDFLKEVWPGKVSVILPCSHEYLDYLHRGHDSLAFRMPDREDLHELLKKTGPLISTSANPEGKKPAETVEDAENYFGDNVDFYVDEGKVVGEPSTLIEIKRDRVKVLREGAVKVK